MLELSQNRNAENVPLRRDGHGVVRVGDTQVTLDVVIGAFDRGATPEQIVQKFGELDLADVYSVLGYALRHENDVREYLAQRQKEATELRREIEDQPSNRELRERLLRLKRRTGSAP